MKLVVNFYDQKVVVTLRRSRRLFRVNIVSSLAFADHWLVSMPGMGVWIGNK